MGFTRLEGLLNTAKTVESLLKAGPRKEHLAMAIDDDAAADDDEEVMLTMLNVMKMKKNTKKMVIA